ncbi:hypothetical protein [Nocardioides aquiterrae]|uniref:Uncharacterized protein n=1 Tax=Nocardioides aquiterrae TaxID=203799 RepID=A0ABP4EWU1_9ACTN
MNDATVEAVGKLSEAFEVIEDARGSLYRFHRLSGRADFALEDAIGMLRDAGHTELADRIDAELLGRNVLPGMWTFQILEGYDDTYYSVFQKLVTEARETLTNGERHAYEARLKAERHTQDDDGE